LAWFLDSILVVGDATYVHQAWKNLDIIAEVIALVM
jgi:hypothetical protein